MQPDQPSPAPNPYEFIMNPQQPQAPKKFPLPLPSNGSKKSHLLLLVGGGLFALIIVIMLFSLLAGGSDETGQKLLKIAQSQTEIVRLSEDAKSKARSSATLNLANTVSLSITSAENQITPLVKKYGGNIDTKSLSAKQSATADQQLAAALQSNQYDTVFTSLIKTQLQSYQGQLKTVYSSVSRPADKQLLKTAYAGATLLLGDNQSN